jgi:zinc and cadmium transporter
MGARRWSQPAIALANIAIALTAPLGVWLFASGISSGTEHISWWIGAAMAFAAGTFLCISLGDLLPEVHFHKHDRLWLSAALLCGLAVPIVLELLPGHTHQVPGDVVPAAKQAAE